MRANRSPRRPCLGKGLANKFVADEYGGMPTPTAATSLRSLVADATLTLAAHPAGLDCDDARLAFRGGAVTVACAELTPIFASLDSVGRHCLAARGSK